MLNYSQIEAMFAEKKYAFFKGHMNLNIFAVRTKTNTNAFDDFIYVAYEDGASKVVKRYACTTDAGKYYLNHPMNPNGTAIMVPGQYRGVYTFGPHGPSKYEALRQCKPIKYYRDNDKDSEHDLGGKIYEEVGYTNIHHAGVNSAYIDKWSAGCIVFKVEANFDEFMVICHKSAKVYGDKFTFTLFSEI